MLFPHASHRYCLFYIKIGVAVNNVSADFYGAKLV